jgi:hypothetical protein
MTLNRIKRWFRQAVGTVEDEAEGASPAATPPPGSGGTGDSERETSTNAQMEGAADEPWPGNT